MVHNANNVIVDSQVDNSINFGKSFGMPKKTNGTKAQFNVRLPKPVVAMVKEWSHNNGWEKANIALSGLLAFGCLDDVAKRRIAGLALKLSDGDVSLEDVTSGLSERLGEPLDRETAIRALEELGKRIEPGAAPRRHASHR